MGLSAVLITCNEEANIERCLIGVSFADEIIIVDSFSMDRTVEIARKFTDKITQREFTGFADQKSAALSLATQEWVLIVDADEVITKELSQEIVTAVKSVKYDAYRIPRMTSFLGKQIRHCGWYPDYIVRLARKRSVRYSDSLVHETLEVNGSCGTLRNPIIHYSYATMDDYSRKMVSYARAAAQQRLREGRQCRISDLVLSPGLTFLKKYLLKQGYRDGLHGFVISALTACSVLLRYSMLWDLSKRAANRKEQHENE